MRSLKFAWANSAAHGDGIQFVSPVRGSGLTARVQSGRCGTGVQKWMSELDSAVGAVYQHDLLLQGS